MTRVNSPSPPQKKNIFHCRVCFHIKVTFHISRYCKFDKTHGWWCIYINSKLCLCYNYALRSFQITAASNHSSHNTLSFFFFVLWFDFFLRFFLIFDLNLILSFHNLKVVFIHLISYSIHLLKSLKLAIISYLKPVSFPP